MWSSSCMAFAAAMWAWMAAWLVFVWIAIFLAIAYILWVYLGILGGVLAAGTLLFLVYLQHQGHLFAAPPK